jgi:hypothetical protein
MNIWHSHGREERTGNTFDAIYAVIAFAWEMWRDGNIPTTFLTLAETRWSAGIVTAQKKKWLPDGGKCTPKPLERCGGSHAINERQKICISLTT